MHENSLKDDIFSYIFNDDDLYRKHYLPTLKHLSKIPEDKDRIKELVDNATMRFCKINNLDYRMIPTEAKNELSIDLYNEIIENEDNRSR